MAQTESGHPVHRSTAGLRLWRITGRGGVKRHLYLHPGNIGFILAVLVYRLDRSVERFTRVWSLWGWAYRPVRGQTRGFSDHASGRAFDFNATEHPRGVHNTWSKVKRLLIRRLLRWCGGIIGWGEDFRTVVDGMHFYERDGVTQARIDAIARKLARSRSGKAVLKMNPAFKVR